MKTTKQLMAPDRPLSPDELKDIEGAIQNEWRYAVKADPVQLELLQRAFAARSQGAGPSNAPRRPLLAAAADVGLQGNA